MPAALSDLIALSSEASESSIVPQGKVAPGGVDPWDYGRSISS